MEVSVSVVGGHIACQPVDAIITAINSAGMWFGGIDGVIQRSDGGHFHAQAVDAMPLKDGQTVVARGNNDTIIKNVVFVVDDMKQPLRTVVLAGLLAANNAGFRSVAIPTMRMGAAQGIVEKTSEEVMEQLCKGVIDFIFTSPKKTGRIIFVVYDDPKTVEALRQMVSRP